MLRSVRCSAANAQGYTISAHGHDDGNLAQVNVWKNGQPLAFGGGGYDGDSGNLTGDRRPASGDVHGAAQAVESAGASSPMISWTVTISATSPVNHAPVISWNTAPATVAVDQSYAISSHGHDDDGNLTQVNVWKNGQPFAFAGRGNGTDGDSGNATSDAGLDAALDQRGRRGQFQFAQFGGERKDFCASVSGALLSCACAVRPSSADKPRAWRIRTIFMADYVWFFWGKLREDVRG